MTTKQLVTVLNNETKEVKQSVGGLQIFREMMDFVLSEKTFERDGEIIFRKHDEIASLIDAKFSQAQINEVKSIYI
jgi:hypothetical protein